MQGIPCKAADFALPKMSLAVVLMMKEHSRKWSIALRDKEEGRDGVSFLAGITDPNSLIALFLTTIVYQKGNRIIRNVESQEFTYLLTQLIDSH